MSKTLSKVKIRDTEVENEVIYSDFKEVDGIWIAHSMEIKAKGAPAGQKMIFEKVELNVPVDCRAFCDA